MKLFYVKFKCFLKKLAWFLIPSEVPRGLTALETFSHDTLDTYSIPNNPTYHRAIATMIMHLGHADRVRRSWVAVGLRAAMAKQVAYEAIRKINEEEKLDKKLELVGAANGEPLQV